MEARREGAMESADKPKSRFVLHKGIFVAAKAYPHNAAPIIRQSGRRHIMPHQHGSAYCLRAPRVDWRQIDGFNTATRQKSPAARHRFFDRRRQARRCQRVVAQPEKRPSTPDGWRRAAVPVRSNKILPKWTLFVRQRRASSSRVGLSAVAENFSTMTLPTLWSPDALSKHAIVLLTAISVGRW